MPFTVSFFILANIFEAGGRSVITVGNNHPILYYNGPDLFALTIGKFPPFVRHTQIRPVIFFLLAFLHLFILFSFTTHGHRIFCMLSRSLWSMADIGSLLIWSVMGNAVSPSKLTQFMNPGIL